MPNPLVDESRDQRWETGVPELNMQQLRAPASLDWLRYEAKPAHIPLGTFALKAMLDTVLIAAIQASRYEEVIVQIVRSWPELLPRVQERIARLTVVSDADGRQNGARKPLAKVAAR